MSTQKLGLVRCPIIVIPDSQGLETDGENGLPIFHPFSWLPVELRLDIWKISAITCPLQIHTFLLEQHEGEEDLQPRYPQLLQKNLTSHYQRIKTVLPLLHACCESRKTTLARYSLVPLRDLLFARPPFVFSGELDHTLQTFNIAVDWSEDTIFCNEHYPFPSPELPWGKQLCSATKLCMPLDEMDTFDFDVFGGRAGHYITENEVDELIGNWVRSVIPLFSKVKEITFAIADITDKPEIIEREYLDGREEPEGERRFTPCPNLSIVGSDLDGGPESLYKYPLEAAMILGGKDGNWSPWWEPLVNGTVGSIRKFHKAIEQERSGIQLNVALDSRIVDELIENCSEGGNSLPRSEFLPPWTE
ncbi:hypothetical protein F5X98DRAFT_377371 [Xylaria grammica]|nr:hypothetical protein F5X98DRAFT_377371 [Xylaria grammica]